MPQRDSDAPRISHQHVPIENAIGRQSPVDIDADGMILYWSTDSTANALSADGPVITPECPVR